MVTVLSPKVLNGPTVSVAAPADSVSVSTTVPLTDAVTVPVASPSAAEVTVTAMFD